MCGISDAAVLYRLPPTGSGKTGQFFKPKRKGGAKVKPIKKMKKYFTKFHQFGGDVHETGGGEPFPSDAKQQEPPVDPVPVDPVLAAAGDAQEVEEKEEAAEVPATAAEAVDA